MCRNGEILPKLGFLPQKYKALFNKPPPPQTKNAKLILGHRALFNIAHNIRESGLRYFSMLLIIWDSFSVVAHTLKFSSPTF